MRRCWRTQKMNDVHPAFSSNHQRILTHAQRLTTQMKWNESGFRPPLCTYRLNWASSTSWGWWDDWDDTVLQTQDSKFEPWRSEVEHATSRSRRLPTILTFIRGWGRNIFVSFKPPRPGTEPRTLAWKAAVLTTTLGPPPWLITHWQKLLILCALDGRDGMCDWAFSIGTCCHTVSKSSIKHWQYGICCQNRRTHDHRKPLLNSLINKRSRSWESIHRQRFQ